MIDITKEQLKIVLDILNKYVLEADVYVFGSRYRGNAKKYSDLDLVLVDKKKIDFATMGKIKEAFEESVLPFRVDVLDWHSTSAEFKKVIEQGYDVIKKADKQFTEVKADHTDTHPIGVIIDEVNEIEK